jgi:hypothetical protein
MFNNTLNRLAVSNALAYNILACTLFTVSYSCRKKEFYMCAEAAVTYFATAVSYDYKLFIALAFGVKLIKLFSFFFVTGWDSKFNSC